MRGFTLIEYLMYIGLVFVILLASGAIGMNILFGKAKHSVMEEVSEAARMVSSRVDSAVRNSESILSPALGTSDGILSLQIADSAKNPTLFDLSNGAVRIKEGTSPQENLTSSNVVISNLVFTNISEVSARGAVRFQFTASSSNQSGRQEYEYGKTFYGTSIIRP